MMGEYLGLRIIIQVVGIIPYRGLRVISVFLAFVLHRILRYRRRTALENLRACFPEKGESELRSWLPKMYLNITDVFLETMKAFTAKHEKLLQYITPPSDEMLRHLAVHYRGAIFATAHTANWEWCGYLLPSLISFPGIAVYRPLKNKKVDTMMLEHRRKSTMEIIPMRQIVKMLASGYAHTHFVLLIADQNPDREGAEWVEFFGRKTAFFKGPATLGRRYQVPVYFVNLERIRRGYYQMQIEPLSMHPEQLTIQELTKLYVEKLETVIRKSPEDWLWTHRRWKHTPPDETDKESPAES